MKRMLLAAAALAVAPALMSAQRAGLSVKGGYSYDNVSNGGALPGDVSGRSGMAIGLGVNTPGPVGFGIEGMYAQRGVTSSTTGDSRNLDYIDVPAYIRLSLPTAPVEPFAYVGPQASFELKCDADGGNCPSGRPKVTYDGVIGAGLRFGRLAGVSVEGRYIYGLTDLKLNTISTSDSYKTRSFMVLVGVGF